MAGRIDTEHDARMIERDIGDIEAPRQQRQPADMSDQALDGQRRTAVVCARQRDLAERHARRGKERHRNRAAHRRLETGRRLHIGHHRMARRVGRNQIGRDRQHDDAEARDDAGGDCKPFEAGGSAHAVKSVFGGAESTLSSSGGGGKCARLCDAFVAGKTPCPGRSKWHGTGQNAIARGFRRKSVHG